MKLSGIDFPKTLLDALSNDSLVIFAGAGVSMGDPANLPDLKRLTETIAEGTGKILSKNKPEDQFLGELKHSGVEPTDRTDRAKIGLTVFRIRNGLTIDRNLSSAELGCLFSNT